MTLIELCVALAVVGIVAASAIPSINNWMPKYRLRVGMRSVSADLALAKMRAVATGENYGLCFHDMNRWIGNATEYTMFRDDGTTPGQLDDGDTIERDHVQLPKDVYCWINVFSQRTVTFKPNGSSNGGWLYLRNDRNKHMGLDVVSYTGRVRIYK
ncbi:GspH/FimT family pseudopilin [Thermodesulfobacteriota bacterium]